MTNPGFEDGLQGWNQIGTAGISFANVRSGSRALRLESGDNRIFRRLPATAGNEFTLQAYFRASSGRKNARIRIRYLNSSFQRLLTENQFIRVGTSYTLVEATATAPPNTAFIEVSIRGFIDNILLADDICLINRDGTPPTNQPDLRTRLRSGNYSGNPGDVANFNFDLINAGTATATGNYRVGFVLSTDANLSNNDVLVGEVNTGNTSVGTISNVAGAITIPSGTNPGNYFLIAKVDFDNVINESNENNNVTSRAFTVNGSTTNNPPNCAAVSNFPWHEWASRVAVNGTVKNSDRTVYSDFTSTNFMIGKDGNNSISLTTKYSYFTEDAYWRVWIDYNQNDIYEANEIFFQKVVSAPADGNGVTSVAQASNVSVPSSALNGATNMRVIVSRNSFADPCGTIAFGEVEDYTAVIGASSASMRGEEEFFFSDTKMVSLAPNPATDRVVIGLDKLQGQAFELMISNQLGQILLRQSFAEEELIRFAYDTSNLPTGIYFIWVKAEGKKSIPQKLIKQRL